MWCACIGSVLVVLVGSMFVLGLFMIALEVVCETVFSIAFVIGSVLVVLVGRMFVLGLFMIALEVVCVVVFPIAFVIHHVESVALISTVMVVQGILGFSHVCFVNGFSFFLGSCSLSAFLLVVALPCWMLRVWLVAW